MSNWIISAFADEYSRSVEKQISALKENGLDHIEVRFVEDKNIADLTADEVIALRKKLDDGGVKVSAVGSPL